jgi:GT2 family glycosyltransferase
MGGLPEKVFIVLVLYKRAPEQSEAFLSLIEVMGTLLEPNRRIDCLIYDNSPEQHALQPGTFPCEYISDPSNPGLARAYNVARQRAEAAGATWLLLLDHDTAITREYLAEVLDVSQSIAGDTAIAAIVPKLIQGSKSLSPQWPNHRNPSHSKPVSLEFSGEIHGKLEAFNSGAVLRLSALNDIGGFDEDFPLDYLDHTTFRQLQRKGHSVYVLRSTLSHELSIEDGWDTPGFQQRFWPLIEAHQRYKSRFARGSERFWHFFWKAWLIFGRIARGQFRTAYRHLKIALQ